MIINDSFVLSGGCGIWKPFGDTEKEKQDAKEFNTRVKACTDMFRWLYRQGILESSSFCFLIEDGTVTDTKEPVQVARFALDSDNLLSFRKAMEESGVENANLACRYIFGDIGFRTFPCHYSGAVMLSWTMMTYRSNCGTVGRSWEIQDIKELSAENAYKVREEKDKNGTKAAITLMWNIYAGLKKQADKMKHIEKTKLDCTVCPVCGCVDTDFIDAWTDGDGNNVESRQCFDCGEIYEVTLDGDDSVIGVSVSVEESE